MAQHSGVEKTRMIPHMAVWIGPESHGRTRNQFARFSKVFTSMGVSTENVVLRIKKTF